MQTALLVHSAGHNEMPLSMLMFLSAKEYAATLLSAGLVSVTKNNKVLCPIVAWELFLADAAIPNYNPIKRSNNCVEATYSQIYSNCFVLDPVCEYIKVVLLRIGTNGDGETTKASMMLNDYCEAPTRPSLWSTLKDLNMSLRPIVNELIHRNDSRLQVVME
jgi:hypothetical protein